MSLKDEFQKLVSVERTALENADNSELDALAKSRRLVDEIRPMLDELVEAANEPTLRVEFRENFAGGGDVTTIICVGDASISKDGSASDVGFSSNGHWWSFWPCYAESGRVSWSFCDSRSEHQWFDSVADFGVAPLSWTVYRFSDHEMFQQPFCINSHTQGESTSPGAVISTSG